MMNSTSPNKQANKPNNSTTISRSKSKSKIPTMINFDKSLPKDQKKDDYSVEQISNKKKPYRQNSSSSEKKVNISQLIIKHQKGQSDSNQHNIKRKNSKQKSKQEHLGQQQYPLPNKNKGKQKLGASKYQDEKSIPTDKKDFNKKNVNLLLKSLIPCYSILERAYSMLIKKQMEFRCQYFSKQEKSILILLQQNLKNQKKTQIVMNYFNQIQNTKQINIQQYLQKIKILLNAFKPCLQTLDKLFQMLIQKNIKFEYYKQLSYQQSKIMKILQSQQINIKTSKKIISYLQQLQNIAQIQLKHQQNIKSLLKLLVQCMNILDQSFQLLIRKNIEVQCMCYTTQQKFIIKFLQDNQKNQKALKILICDLSQLENFNQINQQSIRKIYLLLDLLRPCLNILDETFILLNQKKNLNIVQQLSNQQNWLIDNIANNKINSEQVKSISKQIQKVLKLKKMIGNRNA